MRIELLLFLSVMAMIIVIFACSMPRRQSLVPTPTLFPALTLTSYDPQFASRVGDEPMLAATIGPGSPRIANIDISPPRCYDTVSPQLTCLGYVRNLSNESIRDVILWARFRGANGVTPGETRFSPEQRQIAAGDAAPYRVDAPRSRLETAVLELKVHGASRAGLTRHNLSLRDEAGLYDPVSDSYRLTGSVVNLGTETARDIRLIVSLENEEGGIIGYRAFHVAQALPAGASLPVKLQLTPLTAAADVRHRVTIDAVPYSQP